MKIPFFDLKRQYQSLGGELERAAVEVMRTQQYIEGGAVRELEEQLAAYLGVRHVITCANGTDALRIALQAAGVGPGDEVVTSPFSFFATAEAVAQLGAKPVFADIQPDTLNLDPARVREKLTDRTKAILPVHIFGLPADMDELNAIAAERGIAVVEDACQAIGASYRGRKTGALGRLGCFSFYPTKNLGGCGDGGMITTDDDELANICSTLKAHASGKKGARALRALTGTSVEAPEADGASELYDPYKYYNYLTGWNSRLDSIQAALLSVKLRYLDAYNARRAEIAARYTAAFAGLPLGTQHTPQNDRVSCCHQYAVLCERKADLLRFLAEKGIGTAEFYPVPLHRQVAFAGLGAGENVLPIAEKVCGQSVCLPVFPELTEEEVAYIIESVRLFFRC